MNSKIRKAKNSANSSVTIDRLNKKMFKLKLITYILVIFFSLAALSIGIVVSLLRAKMNNTTFYVLVSFLAISQAIALIAMAVGFTIQSKLLKKQIEDKVGK